MDKNKFFYIALICASLLAVFFVGRSITGYNIFNDTTTGQAEVENKAPTVTSSITCSSPGIMVCNTSEVTCWATAEDENGADDINHSEGKLYLNGTSCDSTNNNTCMVAMGDEYSCDITPTTGNEVNVTCTYTVHYWSEPGNWVGYIYVADADAYDDSNSTIQTDYISTTVAIDATEDLLNFGSLKIGESNITSTGLDNCGNVNLTLTVNATNMTDNSNIIPVGSIKFNSTDIGEFTALSEGAPSTLLNSLAELDTSSKITKYAWFNLTIPDGTPAGSYNNTIKFWSSQGT